MSRYKKGVAGWTSFIATLTVLFIILVMQIAMFIHMVYTHGH